MAIVKGNCPGCGKPVYENSGHSGYCCYDCWFEAHAKTCDWCGGKFMNGVNYFWCSKECYKEAYDDDPEKVKKKVEKKKIEIEKEKEEEQTVAIQAFIGIVIIIAIIIFMYVIPFLHVFQSNAQQSQQTQQAKALTPKQTNSQQNVRLYDLTKGGVISAAQGDPLNLRPCPQISDDCKPIATLERGTIVDILGVSEDGKWYKIKHGDIVGFANSRFVSEKEKQTQHSAEIEEELMKKQAEIKAKMEEDIKSRKVQQTEKSENKSNRRQKVSKENNAGDEAWNDLEKKKESRKNRNKDE